MRNGAARTACGVLFCALALGQKNASYAIVEGTVFRDPGYALADAKVTLRASEPAAGKQAKKQEATTNFRGEFLFRVPAVEAKYVVTANRKGFKEDSKEAAISGGGVPGAERVEVNLVLSPEAK